MKRTTHQWAFSALTRSSGCCGLYVRRTPDVGDGYTAALRHVGSRLLNGLHCCLADGDLYREKIKSPSR